MSEPFDKPSFVTLPQRGLIRVGGEGAPRFLQSLLSNDLTRLNSEPLLYTCLLSPHGKFLHDMFVSKDGDDYLLECEGGARMADLLRRLSIYKLRSKVTLEGKESFAVFASFDAGATPDPRHPSLPYRSYTKPNLPEVDFSAYDELRIRLGIADGSRDAEIEKSTLEELNLAEIAVSFTKGCYIGQELTARIEHRGLSKRHLHALGFAEPPVSGNPVLDQSGKQIGEIRSVCGMIALALIRDDALETLRHHDEKSFVYLLGRR